MRILLAAVFLFGVVGCVADEGSSSGVENEAVTSSALAVQPGEPVEGASTDADIVSSFTLSFTATCLNPRFALNSTGHAVVSASASACRRRNGTFGPPTSWSGFCTVDVTNCNGVIRCGGCG